MKPENIYKEKFKGEGLIVEKHYLPKIAGHKIDKSLMIELGTDVIEGEEKAYIIMKIYMEETK